MSHIKTEAKRIWRIIVSEGRSKRVYTKGEYMELRSSSGEVLKSYFVANITELTEQYEQYKAHIVYIISDEHDNVLAKLHAGNDNLEIICDPL